MTKAAFVAGLKGKPVEFTTPSGMTVFLRPIAGNARVKLEKWRQEHEKDPALNLLLAIEVVAVALTDEAGDVSFTPEEVAEFAVIDADAISKEALTRAGMAETPGKASPPATPS